MSERLLVIEDEKNVGQTLTERLKKEGFDTEWVKSCQEAKAALANTRYDLALVDVGLPDGNGFDIASQIRKQHPSTAVIFLTAFAGPEERVRGLELGAEDYIAKPFHLKELLLRVRNALKRSVYLQSSPSEAVIGRAIIQFDKFTAEVDGVVHHFSQKECALLKLLYERRGQVVSRDEILNQVWSEDEFPTTRTVDNFVVRLRRVVEINPEEPQVIRSVRGVGYQLL